MRKWFVIAVLALATTALANTASYFAKYEGVRKALIAGKLADVKTGAAALATGARTAKNAEVAKLADAVAKSEDIAKARVAFAALSDELIKLRASATGTKPAVYHCPMVKKSWLQEKGKVGNPYDSAMVECGILKSE
jgi:hypothetical protein